MIVVFASQCSKRALPETRRVLDQFMERSGDRSWSGRITLEGLTTIRKLLRKTARRNTAVACHRVHGTQRLELEWVVGNRQRFNSEGKVPTNSTGRDILKSHSENQWQTAEAIALLASLAGLFHDFGKAILLFQLKLKGKRTGGEPLRHEWISLLLFSAFVAKRTDDEWLNHLARINTTDDKEILDIFNDLYADNQRAKANPMKGFSGLAQAIGWLIVTHHRLPRFYGSQESQITAPNLEKLKLDNYEWDASWNSPQCLKGWTAKEWTTQEWQQQFDLTQGTPVSSHAWCSKARAIAKRALQYPQLKQNWMTDNFTSHLARLSLMLADHSYSAGKENTKWWDDDYQVYANTEKLKSGKRRLKQRLDEHNIGVGQNALLLARQLPKLRAQLPALGHHKTLRKRTDNPNYRWQDKAFELAESVAEKSREHGFFGVNMASTGKGKTFANARIMYGLSEEQTGSRFSIALGLRTLTLQTGDALRERLKLDDDELAVLIGSQAVLELYDLAKNKNNEEAKSKNIESEAAKSGSESAEDWFDEYQHVSYEGTLSDGPLRRWLKAPNPSRPNKSLQMLSAPVLVCTIDHLTPATEGTRGGKQIAPMMRLLTSDLVLDEPDDFDSADLPALCRLVNWAGLLGSRVLLSSATMPPVFIAGLFEAYRAGREQYDKACGTSGQPTNICCAWFDEFTAQAVDHAEEAGFKESMKTFIGKRVNQLKKSATKESALRKAELLPLNCTNHTKKGAVEAFHETILKGIVTQHQRHSQSDPATKKQVSLGLVRMANIKPLVAIAQAIIAHDLPADIRLHLCVYHSQFPMMMRSKIEERLDATLARHQPDELWQQPEIRSALDTYPEQQHIFVVLGSPVTEVGRDHDYDWAIAEPSSMRSLIQLAGRIQRHRKQVPDVPNLMILETNFRAQSNKDKPEESQVFCKPGFEINVELPKQPKNYLTLSSKNLNDVLDKKDYEFISSIPRIEVRAGRDPKKSLVDLEHCHLAAALKTGTGITIKGRLAADLWWQEESHPTWHGEMQQRTPFRQSSPDDAYMLYQEDDTEFPVFWKLGDRQELPVRSEEKFNRIPQDALNIAQGVSQWIETDAETLFSELSEDLQMEVADVSRRFGEIRLRRPGENDLASWQYHPWLGVFRELT
jgi:CRISPR-associated endonuclease/helicase Cas3